MRVLVTLTLILLCATKVQCDHESQACSRKESPPDVLSVPLGSELVLSCRGDVTLDGVPLVVTVKPKQAHRTRAATTGQWTSQKTRENPDTTGTYHSETRDTAAHQNVTTSGLQDTKTTPKPATMRTPQAPNRPIQSNRVTRMVEEGGAMEMGMSSEISSEFGESEDYEENEEGLRVTRSIRRQARWTRNGQAIRGGVEKGGVLRLRSLQLVNSGNYSCFRASRLVSSVRIIVSVAPERPSLSCYRKSHTSKIRCEWISMRPIVPRPQCYLLLRKGLEKFSRMNCSYSPERSRCWCAFHYEEGDITPFVAELCVTNTAGSVMSLPLSYSPLEIIKPDPPTRVIVKPIQGQSHTLRVNWSYPATWRQGLFYVLHFQLRYRPVHATKYQEIYVEGTELMWLISDALPHVQYEIQLQAKDEFDGQWSDWSSPVHGYTWTPFPEPTQISDLYTSLDPFWRAYDEGSGDLPANPKVVVKAADGTGLKWVYVLWVVGLCLLIAIAVLFVCSIRVPLISKKCKQCTFPPCSCSTPVPPPLLVPPPQQQSQHYFLSGQEEEGEAVHLHNVDYFFSSYRLDMSES